MSKSKSFFKKTRSFTNRAVRKTQNLLEISKLNFRISSLKSKIERKCSIIGALIVSQKKGSLKKLSESECNEKIDKLCGDVEKLKCKIRKSKAEIKEIKQHMKKCSCYDDCEDCEEACFCDDEFDEDDEDVECEDDLDKKVRISGSKSRYETDSEDDDEEDDED